MNASRRPAVGTLAAVGLGTAVGALLVLFATRSVDEHAARRLEIGVDGVPVRLARDLLLPPHGFTLQLRFDPPLVPDEPEPSLSLTLREERTGLTVAVEDQLVATAGLFTFHVPESLGLREGLLAVRAEARFANGSRLEDWRRFRIRTYLGGPPIGTRQIIHFDFSVDRDGDGRADFEHDLETLGLARSDDREGVRRLALRVAERALARVRRAYDDANDPNRTAQTRDPVAVRFQLEPVVLERERPFTTRICVGGRDPAQPGSVGHVRFDPRNARRAGEECTGEDPAGLFPGELSIYRDAPLFREILGPFDVPAEAGLDVDAAVALLGDALGTLMAHEAAHALGLVPPGKPGYGLFGGTEGEAYAHAVDPDGGTPAATSLMEPGKRFRFEDLAGRGPAGELRFRPLDYAYLRDRVVLADLPGKRKPEATAID